MSGIARTGKDRCIICARIRNMICSANCITAPFFTANDQTKYKLIASLYEGTGGVQGFVTRLSHIPHEHRESYINSILFEAIARIKDPINGCKGQLESLNDSISIIESQLIACKTQIAGFLAMGEKDFKKVVEIYENRKKDGGSSNLQHGSASGIKRSRTDMVDHVSDGVKSIPVTSDYHAGCSSHSLGQSTSGSGLFQSQATSAVHATESASASASASYSTLQQQDPNYMVDQYMNYDALDQPSFYKADGKEKEKE